MAVTPADIKERFPEFATRNDGDITVIIAEAARQVNAVAWGARADDGIQWLTAHLLLNLPKGSKANSGSVTSKAVSKLSLGFSSAMMFAESSLGATVFGKEYMTLRGYVFADRRL